VTIDYWQAWADWFTGREIDPQARLWFMSVLWWGRLGKIISFLGGATIILDLIGPDRLRSLGHDLAGEEMHRKRTRVARLFGGLTIGVVLIAAVALALPSLAIASIVILGDTDSYRLFAPIAYIFPVVGYFALAAAAAVSVLAVVWYGPTALARTLTQPRPAQVLRYTGVACLILGFHFDLLAS